MVTVKVPQEPELLDLWKAAWDRLIWKAMILKVKAIEGELNRNSLDFSRGDLRNVPSSVNMPCKLSLFSWKKTFILGILTFVAQIF